MSEALNRMVEPVEPQHGQLVASNGQLELEAEQLQRSKEVLERYARVGCDDLREPLRAVSTATHLPELRRIRAMWGPRRCIWQRIDSLGAKRKQRLLEDFLVHLRLDRSSVPPQSVPLNEAVDGVVQDLASLVEKHQAVVTRGELPTAVGHDFRLGRAFQDLIFSVLKDGGSQMPRVHTESDASSFPSAG